MPASHFPSIHSLSDDTRYAVLPVPTDLELRLDADTRTFQIGSLSSLGGTDDFELVYEARPVVDPITRVTFYAFHYADNSPVFVRDGSTGGGEISFDIDPSSDIKAGIQLTSLLVDRLEIGDQTVYLKPVNVAITDASRLLIGSPMDDGPIVVEVATQGIKNAHKVVEGQALKIKASSATDAATLVTLERAVTSGAFPVQPQWKLTVLEPGQPDPSNSSATPAPVTTVYYIRDLETLRLMGAWGDALDLLLTGAPDVVPATGVAVSQTQAVELPAPLVSIDSYRLVKTGSQDITGIFSEQGLSANPAVASIRNSARTVDNVVEESAVTLTLTREGDLSQASSVSWSVEPWKTNPSLPFSPVDGADFFPSGLPTGRVDFAAGSNSATLNFTLAANTDLTSFKELFAVQIKPFDDGNAATPNDANVTLGDGGVSRIFFKVQAENTSTTPAGSSLVGTTGNNDILLTGAGALLSPGETSWALGGEVRIDAGAGVDSVTTALAGNWLPSKVDNLPNTAAGSLRGEWVGADSYQLSGGSAEGQVRVLIDRNAATDTYSVKVYAGETSISSPSSISGTHVPPATTNGTYVSPAPQTVTEQYSLKGVESLVFKGQVGTTFTTEVVDLGIFLQPSDVLGDRDTNKNDELKASVRRDNIDGGVGVDTVSYADAKGVTGTQLTVDLFKTRAAQNTGLSGEDRLRNVENVVGAKAHQNTLTGNGFNNELTGGNFGDTIDGGRGNDKLFGGAGVDTLLGGQGNDVLAGGRDADTLTGGSGADRFVFDGVADRDAGAPQTIHTDTITDFNAMSDLIELKNFKGLRAAVNGKLEDLQFVGDDLSSNEETSFVRWVSTGDLAGLYFHGDVDGDGAEDDVVKLAAFSGPVSLTAQHIALATPVSGSVTVAASADGLTVTRPAGTTLFWNAVLPDASEASGDNDTAPELGRLLDLPADPTGAVSLQAIQSALNLSGANTATGVRVTASNGASVDYSLTLVAPSTDKIAFATGASSLTVSEGTGGLKHVLLAVTRTDDNPASAATVNWRVSAASGLTGGQTSADAADFGGILPSGTLTFLADETEKFISIPILGDNLLEGTEAFDVRLDSATGATIDYLLSENHSARVVIENDDVEGGDPGGGTGGGTGSGPLASYNGATLSADGATVTLNYAQPLQAMASASNILSQFIVKVNNTSVAVSDGSVNGSSVLLNLTSPIAANSGSVTVSYTDPNPATDNAAGTVLEYTGGADVPSIGDTPVVRFSFGDGGSGAPTLVYPAVLGGDGTKITLTFSESLNGTVSASHFRVEVDHEMKTVSSATVSGSTVTLTLQNAITVGMPVVSVSYTDPSPNNESTGVIQDADGNDTASFQVWVDQMSLAETTAARDVVTIPSPEDSTPNYWLKISNFDVSEGNTYDVLNLPHKNVAVDVLNPVNGTQAVGSVAKHSVNNGMVAFFDASSAAVTITQSNLQDALKYVQANFSGVTGAFTMDALTTTGGVDSTVVFQTYGSKPNGDGTGMIPILPTVVSLLGTVATGVASEASQGSVPDQGVVRIMDSNPPDVIGGHIVLNNGNGTLELFSAEPLALDGPIGVSLEKNGSALIAPPGQPSVNGSRLDIPLGPFTANDWLLLSVPATGPLGFRDLAGNAATGEGDNFGWALGANGNNEINLSVKTGYDGFALDGRGGNDNLIGSALSDEIAGGTGGDTLTGGGGGDQFGFEQGDATAVTFVPDGTTGLNSGDIFNLGSFFDRIMDFSAGDEIFLSQLGGSGVGGNYMGTAPSNGLATNQGYFAVRGMLNESDPANKKFVVDTSAGSHTLLVWDGATGSEVTQTAIVLMGVTPGELSLGSQIYHNSVL